MKKLLSLIAVALMSFSMTLFPKPVSVKAAPLGMNFAVENVFSTYWRFYSPIIHLNGSRHVIMVITGCDTAGCQLTQSPGIGDAVITFYNSSNVATKDFDLSALIQTTNANGTYDLDLDLLTVPTSSYFRVSIPYAYVGSNPYLSLVNNSTYDLWPAEDVHVVQYIDGTTIIDTQTFVDYPDPTNVPSDPTRAGYQFAGWAKANGTIYDFLNIQAIPDSDLINNTFYLYASFFPVETANFMNGLVVFDTTTFTDTVTRPASDPVKASYVFQGWYDRFDVLFDFSQAPTEAQYNPSDGELYLYAKWSLVLPNGTVPTEGVPNAIAALANLLTAFGMYNFPGLMFVYMVTMVALMGLLAWFIKPDTLIYIIVGLVVTTIFMFMQLLPLYASVIMIAFHIVALVYSFNSSEVTA